MLWTVNCSSKLHMLMVSLRWLYDQGVTFVMKSYNKARMTQNLDIFDFSRTNDDSNYLMIWLYDQDVTFVMKSYNKARIKQNLDIFDFSLTNDDYQKINHIKQERKLKNGSAAFDLPYLFDGEN
ncbi:hypothetical protein Ahy_B06g085308 [Arachis hypogaea]|uniref:NADP-dependent oxidoreductase domain-containing protein n=1 Tax=Arachis hypogaea TaxID=3818 RepID=A0A444YU33_ARAHY|nr:hypothetical protein Ahy_B06g085308 [Arachis hypogaea]